MQSIAISQGPSLEFTALIPQAAPGIGVFPCVANPLLALRIADRLVEAARPGNAKNS